MKRFLLIAAVLAALIPAAAVPAAVADTGPAPAASTCSIVYDTQGGQMPDTSTQTVAVGGTMVLRTGVWGPANFNGWFSSPFKGFDVAPDAGSFVGYGLQVVNVPCTAGGTRTLYAHWIAPGAAVTYPTLSTRINYLMSGEAVTATGCAGGCGVNVTSSSGAFNETLTPSAAGVITFSLAASSTVSWWIQFPSTSPTQSISVNGSSASFWNGSSSTALNTSQALTVTTSHGYYVVTFSGGTNSLVTVVYHPTAGLTGSDALTIYSAT